MTRDVRMGKYIDIRCYKQVRFIIKNFMKKEKLYKARGSWQGIWENKIGVFKYKVL